MRTLLYSFIFVGLFFSIANAQMSGSSRNQKPMGSFTHAAQKGFAGYIAANAGYTNYNQNLDVEGAPTSVKALISWVSPETTGVYDFGYGVQNQSFSQNAAVDKGISTGALELAARYQMESLYQIGAVFNQLFDKGASYGANQSDAQFIGAQVLKEFSFGENNLGRVGGRFMTSLNVNNESVNMTMLDVQIGWGAETRSTTTTSN